ncbi:MAG: hypothetical protein KatS3mg082_0251 [Nitrospiraceae bacterium]|nr:MAG: hypothetical protein KatS3mg082_0251 [Nitrospiraceae bacterium]
MQIDFHIGGHRIRIEEASGLPCLAWPLSPFHLFAAPPTEQPDIHVHVAVSETLPDLARGPLCYDACHGLWTLFGSESGFLLECLDTQTLAVRSRALLSPDFSFARVWTFPQRLERTCGWSPMLIINPLVEICLLTRLARQGGLWLHAAGVLIGGKGFAFAGASGSGKSTIADWFASRDSQVLSDERIMISRSPDGFTLWGTPWVGTGRHAKNASGRLSRLYFIEHGRTGHCARELSPRAVVERLLHHCFLPYWDRQALETSLGTAVELVTRIPCAGLAFLNDPSIVDWTLAHAATRDPVLS